MEASQVKNAATIVGVVICVNKRRDDEPPKPPRPSLAAEHHKQLHLSGTNADRVLVRCMAWFVLYFRTQRTSFILWCIHGSVVYRKILHRAVSFI